MDATTRATVLCCRIAGQVEELVRAVKHLVAVRASGTEAEVADALSAAQSAGHSVTETASDLVRVEMWSEVGERKV